MILAQKLKFFIAIVLIAWLVILVRYIGHRQILQDGLISKVKSVVNENINARFNDNAKSNLTYKLPPPADSENDQAQPKSHSKVGVVEDQDMSEVNFKQNDPKSKTTSTSRKPRKGTNSKEQQQIVNSFLHAWKAYKKYAWGHDELKPVSKSSHDWMYYGLTIVDSLDTLHIMGLKKEFKEAKRWVKKDLEVQMSQTYVQFFEIVIRLLGGLLSAYHLTKDVTFLNKANEFGAAMKPCFEGMTFVPCHKIDLERGSAQFENSNLAEIGTIQLEFRDLGRSMNMSEYEVKSFSVSEHIHKLTAYDGLLPSLFMHGQHIQESSISMGGQSDSYYEYLLKQWIQTGKTIDWLKQDYLKAIAGAERHLMRRTTFSNMLYVGSMYNNDMKTFSPVMEHLTCFLPGTLALGYLHGLPQEHLDLAKDLMATCYDMYQKTILKLSPESVNFIFQSEDNNFVIDVEATYNIHRPETIESLFYLYRVTKNRMYRTWAWSIYKAFEANTRLKEGYAGIQDVHVEKSKITYINKMETFYLAETLKYLYLLFSDDDDLLPLDKWVFNTEAHPLPIYNH